MNLADKYGELILDDFAYRFEVVRSSCKGHTCFLLTSPRHSLALGTAHNYKREVCGIVSELMKLIRYTGEKTSSRVRMITQTTTLEARPPVGAFLLRLIGNGGFTPTDVLLD